MNHIAYIDRDNIDEIIEVGLSPALPQRGDKLQFSEGDAKGRWQVNKVVCPNDPLLDALVYMERKG